jgi:hypothetical protein
VILLIEGKIMTPAWVTGYLASVRRLLEEADQSADPRVKLLALRVLERQGMTIRELGLDHWADSLSEF